MAFGKRGNPPGSGDSSAKSGTNRKENLSPAMESLLAVIAEKKPEDPLIGLKVGANEINNKFLSALKDDRGVHIETFLTILAALGGFSCQMSIREGLIKSGKATEAEAFTIVEGKDGKRYFFGDLLNAPLAENPDSILSLAAGAAQSLGCENFPDFDEIFKHVSATVGSDSFGKPRYPEGHDSEALPVVFIKDFWPVVLPDVEMFCEKPSEWPVLFGIALHRAIVMGKDALDPALAVRIVMETAIPMSKVDPADILVS